MEDVKTEYNSNYYIKINVKFVNYERMKHIHTAWHKAADMDKLEEIQCLMI